MTSLNDYFFSIITIVNKPAVVQEFKKKLNEQIGVRYELIPIWNDHNQFDSAREAYNRYLSRTNGDYVIFTHPDINFLREDSLSTILQQVIKLPNLGVAGIAGSPWEHDGRHAYIVSNIVQGKEQKRIGKHINKPRKVQTVDECFFIMTREYLCHHPFSAIKGWHMYAVEQCLEASINGFTNYVVPAKVWHDSTGGSEDRSYVITGKQIVKKYGKHFPYINTTVTKWETQGWKAKVYPWLKFYKRQIRRKMGLYD